MPEHPTAPTAAAGTRLAEPTRVRMSPQERRRQLVGIGLRKFVEQPVQELSLDEVAAEAGVSRGLLFHYFPTKTAYYEAVVEAAGRRILRTLAPDAGLDGDAALAQFVERFLAQVARRRDSYLALVHGQLGTLHEGAGATHADRALTLRQRMAEVAIDSGGLPDASRPVVHAWVAYVEDRAMQWSALPPADQLEQAPSEVAHCLAALHALVALHVHTPMGIVR